MDFCESKMFNSNRSNLLKLGGGSTVSPAAACHRPCRGTDEVGCGTSSVATSFFSRKLRERVLLKNSCSIDHQHDKTIADHQPLTTANDKTIADHQPLTIANDENDKIRQ